MLRVLVRTLIALMPLLTLPSAGLAQSTFVNWETPHVHPLDITPDSSRLLACNLADNRLEIFDITSGRPVHVGVASVGLDPVTVRARTANEAWVVSHISDSVNIVDLTTLNVVATLRTDDEPCDVVFAGAPQQAYVSCSQANTVLVFDPANLAAAPTRIAIVGEGPRALAVNAAGTEVYVAIFESGNRSTIVAGGATGTGTVGFPPNAVNTADSPYFDESQPLVVGVNPPNPPPNSGANFSPPLDPGNGTPPRVGMIVKKDSSGQWLDDNNHDWTPLVSGAAAAQSGRLPGWDLYDHDVAIIDTATLGVRYATGCMNICMALAVNPATGDVTVVGTDATNEVRFEPVVAGRFIRVEMAHVDPATTAVAVNDLNPQLIPDYNRNVPFAPLLPPEDRVLSLGDPRGIAWNAAGTRGWVSGMGSNNVIQIDAAGDRAGGQPVIPVGEGPTGVAIDDLRGRVYVLNKFEATISTIDTVNETELLPREGFYDPTPQPIRLGRATLYNTHLHSGLGQVACGSCHVDARNDRLVWDLGDPGGAVKVFNQVCNVGLNLPGAPPCEDWHPMKGPMATQTLQDIIGKEPHHWRGDRNGIEEFSDAFATLQGGDAPVDPLEMQLFENFLATIHFPPNPYRNFDNTLPTNLPLPGHFATGRFGPAGQPLPNGNAVAGLASFRTAGLDGGLNCVTCHTLPTGAGTDFHFVGGVYQPNAPGPSGERHLAIVSIDGSTNVSIKVPQLRSEYEKTGFNMAQPLNTAGFGVLHDGSVDSLERFVAEPAFSVTSDQQIANLVALLLAFSGSDLPLGSPTSILEPPGPLSRDTRAAVGWQTTVNSPAPPAGQATLIANMLAQANAGKVGVVVKGRVAGQLRGWRYNNGANRFQSDRAAESPTPAQLLALAGAGSELTYTVVPSGTQTRIGIDRDLDGFFDRDELDACADPADATSTPGNSSLPGDLDGDHTVGLSDLATLLSRFGSGAATPAEGDLDGDQDVDIGDLALLLSVYGTTCP